MIVVRWVGAVLLSALLAACAVPPKGDQAALPANPAAVTQPTDADLVRQFKAAIEKAKQPNTLDDIRSGLMSLGPNAPSGTAPIQQDGKVLVALLLAPDTYNAYYKNSHKGFGEFTKAPVIWVTLAPQLQAFCQSTGLTGEALQRRLKQYLGLDPTKPRTDVVELWVEKDDLFRPCPDPETNDDRCSLNVEGQSKVKNIDNYKAFYDGMVKSQPDSAPWTRLGYTYDYGVPGEAKRDHFGASEFIITANALYRFERAAPVDFYCTPPRH